MGLSTNSVINEGRKFAGGRKLHLSEISSEIEDSVYSRKVQSQTRVAQF